MNTLNALNTASYENSIRAGIQPRRSNGTAAPRLESSEYPLHTPAAGLEAPPLPNDQKRRTNREDFAKIYQEHHPKVLQICGRMLGSPEEAEDAANDVFLKLPNSLESYDSSQPFAPWLARVASNHCIDLLRRRRSEMRVIQPEHDGLPETAAPLPSPFEDLVSKESSDVVRDAIFRLPERYLVPLVMRYFSDLSYNEIAKTLGTTNANVGLLIFRAKQQLRSILAGREIQPRPGAKPRRLRQTGSWQGASGWLGQPAAVLGTP